MLNKLENTSDLDKAFAAALWEPNRASCIRNLSKVVQGIFPTTTPSHRLTARLPFLSFFGSKWERVCFKSGQEIHIWSQTHATEQIANFKALCAHFDITVAENEDTGYTFTLSGDRTQIFSKELRPIWTRAIQSLVLCHPTSPLPTQFCHFLKQQVEALTDAKLKRVLQKESLPKWEQACAPKLVPNPIANLLSKISERFQVCVQKIINTQSYPVDIQKKVGDAFKHFAIPQQRVALPEDTTVLFQKENTQILLSPHTSFEAVQTWTPRVGPLAALNFANDERPGGGFLGFGRAQEESGVHRGTLLHQFFGLYRLGDVTYHPENQKLFGATHSEHKIEGSYPFQLQYTSTAKEYIDGQKPYLLPTVPNQADTLDPDHVAAHRCAVLYDPATGKALEHPYPYWDMTAAVSDRSQSPTPNTYTEEEKVAIRNTIKAILCTAALAGYKNVLLGALGCGAFKHDPRVIATLFREVITSSDFAPIIAKFDRIIFPIPDATSHNFTTFEQVLSAPPQPIAPHPKTDQSTLKS